MTMTNKVIVLFFIFTNKSEFLLINLSFKYYLRW